MKKIEKNTNIEEIMKELEDLSSEIWLTGKQLNENIEFKKLAISRITVQTFKNFWYVIDQLLTTINQGS